jgi:hypothetical protein
MDEIFHDLKPILEAKNLKETKSNLNDLFVN